MKKFAFLAHRVEPWNTLLDFDLFKHLHKNSKLHWFWIWLAPFYWSVSVISLFSKRGYDIVDDFYFLGETKSQTILLKNYNWHFVFKQFREKIRRRILKVILDAQKENGVIGLGALTKAEWLTGGGEWIVSQLGNNLKVPLVHGDTLTAATVLQKIESVRVKYKIGLDSPVFITGSTSKIGRALVLSLAKKKIPVKMMTSEGKKGNRYLRIKEEAGAFTKYISQASSLEEGKDCNLWITGKSKPAGKRLLCKIPQGAIVINFSVPNPLGENHNCLRQRLDLILIEGGLLAYDPSRTNLSFTMRLSPGLTYACHAGTAIHAFKEWGYHEVGQIDLSNISEVWKVALEIGFKLPELISCKEAGGRKSV
jgi:hypothetical protein